jgi:hypothetical protein
MNWNGFAEDWNTNCGNTPDLPKLDEIDPGLALQTSLTSIDTAINGGDRAGAQGQLGGVVGNINTVKANLQNLRSLVPQAIPAAQQAPIVELIDRGVYRLQSIEASLSEVLQDHNQWT